MTDAPAGISWPYQPSGMGRLIPSIASVTEPLSIFGASDCSGEGDAPSEPPEPSSPPEPPLPPKGPPWPPVAPSWPPGPPL